MIVSAVFPLVVSAFVAVTCQQPLDDLSEISPYIPAGNIDKSLLQQCEFFAQTLSDENERLKNEMKILRMKVEALEEMAEEEGDEEEDEKDGSAGIAAGSCWEVGDREGVINIYESWIGGGNCMHSTGDCLLLNNYESCGGRGACYCNCLPPLEQSKERSRSLRRRRAAGCEGGTLAAWACAPQCVFKLKGLCGLSLKSICHC